MKRTGKLVLAIAIAMLALGFVCFALSLLLGADLVRIADVVFGKYDLTQTYLNFQELWLRIVSIF